MVQSSLVAPVRTARVYGELQHLIWQVQTFGFHLAELEVRQHVPCTRRHSPKLARVASCRRCPPRCSRRFAHRGMQDEYGVDACRRYVISFTHVGRRHRGRVRASRFCDRRQPPVLDVVPLFETQADLDRSVPVLDEALKLPAVQARLAANGRRFEVMLGYSDSAKDVGPVSATLRSTTRKGARGRGRERHDISFDVVPRSGWRARPRRWPGEPRGVSARLPDLSTAASRSPSRAR